MSKIGYGLNLRLPSQQKKKQQPQQSSKPPRPSAFGFNDDDDDDVESDISRQASKNKSLKDIDEQQKKALEEDPTVFDYDGVYDDMKQKAIQPRVQDRQDRMPRYIQLLKEKIKEREKYHEVVYERKIAKERSQDDHLCADKDKFVTSANKKKLEEQRKWIEEERCVNFERHRMMAKGSALSVEGEEPIKQPLISAPKVLDTTGARDTFTAAFVVALVEGKSRNESLKFSAAAASLCVQVKGALPSMPDRKSVLALLQSH